MREPLGGIGRCRWNGAPEFLRGVPRRCLGTLQRRRCAVASAAVCFELSPRRLCCPGMSGMALAWWQRYARRWWIPCTGVRATPKRGCTQRRGQRCPRRCAIEHRRQWRGDLLQERRPRRWRPSALPAALKAFTSDTAPSRASADWPPRSSQRMASARWRWWRGRARTRRPRECCLDRTRPESRR